MSTFLQQPHDSYPRNNNNKNDKATTTTTIILRSLQTHAILGSDIWSRTDKVQTLLLTVHLALVVPPSAASPTEKSANTTNDDANDEVEEDDTLTYSFSYSQIAKDILRAVTGAKFADLAHLTREIAHVAESWPGVELNIEATAPKALLRVDGERGGGLRRAVCLVRPRGLDDGENDGEQHEGKREGGGSKGIATTTTTTTSPATATAVAASSLPTPPPPPPQRWHLQGHEWTIAGLRIPCIIGLNPHERLEKQDVVFTIRVVMDCDDDDHHHHHHNSENNNHNHNDDQKNSDKIAKKAPWHQAVTRLLFDLVEPSSFRTVEALAAYVARHLLSAFPWFEKVGVRVEKPVAVTFAAGAGAEIERGREWVRRGSGSAG